MDIFLYFIYFIYGMAFLGMGLTIALEYGRITSLPTRKIFLPLSIFGFIHGFHEWFEAYFMFSKNQDLLKLEWIPWLRIILLALSFLFLLIYGIQTFQQPGGPSKFWRGIGISALIIYFVMIIYSTLRTYHFQDLFQEDLFDVLARYLLAVPGAILAALAMEFQSSLSRFLGKEIIAKYMRITGIAFGIYALSQLFVQSLDLFPALYLNADAFRSFTGIPVQAVRAGMAVTITISMYKTTDQMEKDRRLIVETAQTQRIEALNAVKEELTKKEELRRELLRHIVQAQEEERARIARELHDETAQSLTAISLDLAAIREYLPREEKCDQLSGRLQSHFKEMSQGIYRLVHDLRPAQLDDLGLIPTLQYLIDHVTSNFNLKVQFKVHGNIRRLDSLIETVLFRVAQEAFVNIHRHAETEEAQLSLNYDRQEITLVIEDSGIGFNPESSFIPPHGWGLAGMRERVEAVGGQLNINSSPGSGTVVKVIVNVFDIIP